MFPISRFPLACMFLFSHHLLLPLITMMEAFYLKAIWRISSGLHRSLLPGPPFIDHKHVVSIFLRSSVCWRPLLLLALDGDEWRVGFSFSQMAVRIMHCCLIVYLGLVWHFILRDLSFPRDKVAPPTVEAGACRIFKLWLRRAMHLFSASSVSLSFPLLRLPYRDPSGY